MGGTGWKSHDVCVVIDVDGLEEQRFAIEVQDHSGGLPMRRRNLGLFNEEAATFVQLAENSPSETYLFEERAVDFCQAVSGFVHHHLTLHSGEDHGLAAWRIEAGAGDEFNAREFVAVGSRNAAEIGEVECVRDGRQHLAGALVVLALILQFASHLRGISHFADALLLVALLLRIKRLVINQHDAVNGAVGCVYQLFDLSLVSVIFAPFHVKRWTWESSFSSFCMAMRTRSPGEDCWATALDGRIKKLSRTQARMLCVRNVPCWGVRSVIASLKHLEADGARVVAAIRQFSKLA